MSQNGAWTSFLLRNEVKLCVVSGQRTRCRKWSSADYYTVLVTDLGFIEGTCPDRPIWFLPLDGK